jgi:cysteinyl-tRNA synthetase
MSGHTGVTPPRADPRTDAAFTDALAAGDLPAALGMILDLDLALEARLRSGEDSPELDEARAGYRALLVRLTDAAGSADAHDALAPVVETILDLRSEARAAGDFPTADRIRDRLVDAGIEVRDGAAGSEWSVSGSGTR